MKKHWKWAVGIVAFCILAPIVSGVVALEIRSRAVHDGAAVVSQFLADLNTHDYTAAHALMAPSEQSALPVAAVRKAQKQLEYKHGRWLSQASPNEYHPNDALDHITYFYTVDFKKDDEIYVMVSVVRTNDGWRVSEYHYDYSPA